MMRRKVSDVEVGMGGMLRKKTALAKAKSLHALGGDGEEIADKRKIALARNPSVNDARGR